MATIEIDESLIPKGYEVAFAGIPSAGEPVLTMDCGIPTVSTWCSGNQIRIVLRPKPRKLKAIVFEVAGDERPIKEMEWCWKVGWVGVGPFLAHSPIPSGHIPLIRREVYQGDDDAAK